jgi:hypothetical protein
MVNGCTSILKGKDSDINISNVIDTRPSKVHAWRYDSTYFSYNFLSEDPKNFINGTYNRNNNGSYDFNMIIIESFLDYENMMGFDSPGTYNVYEYDAFNVNMASKGEYNRHYYFALSRILAFWKRLQLNEQGFDKNFSREKCDSYANEWIKANCYFYNAIMTKNKAICPKLPWEFAYYGEFKGPQGHGPNAYSLETRPVIFWNMSKSCNEIIKVLEINRNINFDEFCSFALQGDVGYLNEEECDILSEVKASENSQ